ncbi:MAG: DUF4276 family protein [Bryobacteraceae bacterium]
MKFALYVEGYTERALSAFLKRWLDPRLSIDVRVDPVRFSGSGDYLKSFAQRAKKGLDSGRLTAVVGLLDLYRVGLDFPPNLTTDEKCTWAKAELERQVGDPRFRQHFAVHETEAWLLSDPEIFPTPIRERLKRPAKRPESVNFREPPAKLLERAYRAEGLDYKKVTDGSKLFAKLAPNLSYERCPHLRMLLDDMLSLAKAAGC